MVIVTGATMQHCMSVNEYCRSRGIKFIAANVSGVFGWSFCDFGAAHEVHDTNGESVSEIKIASCTTVEMGSLIKTLEGEEHDLQEGDTVSLDPDSSALVAKVVRVVRSDQFVVDKASHGWKSFLKVKQVVVVSQVSMRESFLGSPQVIGSDFSKSGTGGSVLLGLHAVDEFRGNQAWPRPWNEEDAAKVVQIAQSMLPFVIRDSLFGSIETTQLDVALVKSIAYTASGMLHPLCAFLGGSVAQEAQKALTGKFMPQHQWALFDAREVLANRSPTFDAAACAAAFAQPKTRIDMLGICCGEAVVKQLASTSLFMIGVGAIGCELLKNFAMIGIATNGEATVQITDCVSQ